MDTAELLCRVDFPLYQARMISPRHLLLAGGGGAAKTGVMNGFVVVEISHNGTQCVALSTKTYQTGEFAVMNLAANIQSSIQTVVAAGHKGLCQLYQFNLGADHTDQEQCHKAADEERHSSVVHRRANGAAASSAKTESTSTQQLVYDISPLRSIQTDFTEPEPYQKVCQVSCDGKLLATGGDDGVLRLWTFPELNAVHEMADHSKEVDDVDFSPDNSKLVTVSKDLRAIVWDVKRGKKHAELFWDTPSKFKYVYKRIRFARVEGDSKRYKLFSIVNPLGSSKLNAYLQSWDTKNYSLNKAVPFQGSLSALAVSDNGNFVAIGAMFEGIVEIYTAFNLCRLKRVERAHSSFITGLEFLPTGEEADPMRGFSDTSVVSISIDHQVCLHHVPRMKKISLFATGIIVIVVLMATFVVCSYLGL